MMRVFKVLFAIAAILSTTFAWHVCQDEPFCKELRSRSTSKFTVDYDSFQENCFSGTLVNSINNQNYDLNITFHHDDVVRIRIRESNAEIKPIPSALLDDLVVGKVFCSVDCDSISIVGGNHQAFVNFTDFSITTTNLITNDVIHVNGARDMFVGDSLALKVTFENMQNAYGIPEHGDNLKLKDTKNDEPYRHYNLDYGYYQTESRESLYGSVPVLYAHGVRPEGESHVSGVFWHNPAQTFVDIDHSNNSITVDFISQAGTLDLFILPGGDFKSAVSNYVKLTGTAPLPPLFAMGYHQSRYSYLTQEDVLRVAKGLQDGEFPLDVMWLDIDYTDGKRYFTWDYNAFPDPIAMQYELSQRNLRLVTIIDPHIKAENGYFVYDQMRENGYYVMNPDGTIYQGSCWPGLSSYVDFFNPDALNWWSSLYGYSTYANTTAIVHIWNDMNEPSVFDVEEKTMAWDILHYGNIQHKEVHNMYGHMQTKGTYQGLVNREEGHQRPFLLTRSHFAGTQRYAAIWTGDNIATWEHLRVSIPICLSEALAGISFCGADVGGFIERPSDELFQRWYQLGAWYPFMRAHSNNEQDYREPFLYPEEIQGRFRTALRQRYAHLPYWYTTWYEHQRYGQPVMRPLVYNYPNDENVNAIDTEFMIGDNILIAPVLYEGANELDVYLPEEDIWFYLSNKEQNEFRVISSSHVRSVDMDSVPVFYRGGSIIPRKDIVRGSTQLMQEDPYNLYIFAKNNNASGTLYEDDTVSFSYQSNEYNYLSLTFDGIKMESKAIDTFSSYNGHFSIGSVFIYFDEMPSVFYAQAVLTSDGSTTKYPVLQFENMLQIDFNTVIEDRNFDFVLKYLSVN
ncbi:neutral alpha-glucosidase AB-like [Atheta coriaria]|uniref:neutral alpha-glucosidase AB-like n=1 Tax=Dalotia coriaria TaxID=877792 RepID=UPI0031F3ED72